MTTDQELALVKEAQQNIQAFDTLYRYYVKRIFSYCFYRLSSRELAEDVTSQVFLTACEKIHTFDLQRGTKFSSWLYQTAHNKIVDTYRKNSKSMTMELDEEDVHVENDHDKQVVLAHMEKDITDTLNQLKGRYQEVISLRFFSELEIGEIAEVMNLKPTNVSVLLHRAMESFRKKYKKLFPESEIFEFYTRSN